MRFLLCVLCLATPALAESPALETCAVDPDLACRVEALLPDLALIDAQTLLTAPDRLTVLATAGAQPVAVELSLTDGSTLRSLPLQLPPGDMRASSGLVGRAGGGYALLLWQGGTTLGLQFFGPDGAPLGRLSSPPPADWPMELGLEEALALLAGQGVLAFDGATLEGTLYRFQLRVAASDGALTVTETRPANGAEDTLGAYLARRLARQIDPVGAEVVHVEGPLSSVTSWASDGTPSRLLLRSEDGGEMAFDQRLGPDRMAFDYLTARVTPDGTRLAAIRRSATDTRLMVFDTGTTVPVFQALLPQGGAQQLLWLDGGRIAVLQDTDDAGTRVLVLDTR